VNQDTSPKFVKTELQLVTPVSPRLPVFVKKMNPLAGDLPYYATPGAACFDLHACFIHKEDCAALFLGESVQVGCGWAFQIPEDHVMLVFSRSGHAFKHGVRLANSVAVIDSDFRGEVQIKLTREHDATGTVLDICHGDRIAQAMVIPLPRVVLLEVDELLETSRGAGGLGSTGSKPLEHWQQDANATHLQQILQQAEQSLQSAAGINPPLE
jgi:dUTP pyrophosphatase